MLTQPHNFVIQGGTFNEVNVQGPYYASSSQSSNGFNLLHRAIASGAFHNSDERFDPPKCHPETRKAVLNTILEWNADESSGEGKVMWLYGPAGAGKSAIAQTIAEQCEEQGTLAASFFFSRMGSGRNNEKSLIPTIAYQLCLSIPMVRSYIELAVENDLSLFSRTIEVQLLKLVIEPLAQAMITNPSVKFPSLIILDGLDECQGEKVQSGIVNAIAAACSQSRSPFHFLIVSRPEQNIMNAFNSDKLHSISKHLILDDSFQPNEDIKLFLSDGFLNIISHHPFAPLIPHGWPTEDDIDTLVYKSSGQFIYASTVIKYVKDLRQNPVDRLRTILGIKRSGSNTPFSELDQLYTQVLQTVENLAQTMPILETVLHIHKSYSEPSDRFCTTTTYPFLEEFLTLERGNIYSALSELHSIVHVPGPLNVKEGIYFVHASFGDFLSDRARSHLFFINHGVVNNRLTQLCLNHLQSVMGSSEWMESDPHPQNSISKRVKEYAYGYWMSHCVESSASESLLKTLKNFKVQLWLQRQRPPLNPVHNLPHFFEWLEQQDETLYSHYLSRFAAFWISLIKKCRDDGYLVVNLAIMSHNNTFALDSQGCAVLLGEEEGNLKCSHDDLEKAIFMKSADYAGEYFLNPALYSKLSFHSINYMLTCMKNAPHWNDPHEDEKPVGLRYRELDSGRFLPYFGTEGKDDAYKHAIQFWDVYLSKSLPTSSELTECIRGLSPSDFLSEDFTFYNAFGAPLASYNEEKWRKHMVRYLLDNACAFEEQQLLPKSLWESLVDSIRSCSRIYKLAL